MGWMGGATQFCKYREENAVCLIILLLCLSFFCSQVDSKYIPDRRIIQELSEVWRWGLESLSQITWCWLLLFYIPFMVAEAHNYGGSFDIDRLVHIIPKETVVAMVCTFKRNVSVQGGEEVHTLQTAALFSPCTASGCTIEDTTSHVWI